MYPINEQPISSIMNATTHLNVDHESPCCSARRMHKSCHYTRLRRLVIPAVIVLLTTATILFVEFSDFNAGVGASGSLLRRATDTTSGSSPGFVKNKRASCGFLNFYTST